MGRRGRAPGAPLLAWYRPRLGPGRMAAMVLDGAGLPRSGSPERPGMHLLLVTIGSRGDLYPFLGLGRAMTARGHRVTVITTGNHRAAAGQAGLGFIELGSADLYERFMADLVASAS